MCGAIYEKMMRGGNETLVSPLHLRASAPPRLRTSAPPRLFLHTLLLLLSLLLITAGCAVAPDATIDESAGRGGSSPEQVVESFVEDLNKALADKNLAEASVRRSWAERLASYFAPSERIDQRTAMGEMLAGFVDGAQRPVVGSTLSLSITFTRIELLSRSDDKALVAIVDGTLLARWRDDKGELLRERSAGLMDVIGQTSGGLPVLRVGSQWFLTEG